MAIFVIEGGTFIGEGGTFFLHSFGFEQGVRLLGIGTQFFMQNLAGGTFIRVGTLIRQCIVNLHLLSFSI